jgi:Fe-S cluster biogenesis protein NfuA
MNTQTLSPSDIKIQAQVQNEQLCFFVVDRPVFPDGAAYFNGEEAAKGSPLAEQLLDIEGVQSVIVRENLVKVGTSGIVDWLPIARTIGGIIRSVLISGVPPISDSFRSTFLADDVMNEKIQNVFDEEINPFVETHGGNVELMGVKNNVVYLRLGGGCQGCGMASVTLRSGIERAIRDALPSIGDIVDITDHAAGTNPFYKPHTH